MRAHLRGTLCQHFLILVLGLASEFGFGSDVFGTSRGNYR